MSFEHNLFLHSPPAPAMVLKSRIHTVWAAAIVLWQRSAYLSEGDLAVTVYEQTTQNLAKS